MRMLVSRSILRVRPLVNDLRIFLVGMKGEILDC